VDKYQWFGGGMMTECGTSWWYIWWVFGFIECLFLLWDVLFGDDVVNGLLHTRYLFIFMEVIICWSSKMSIKIIKEEGFWGMERCFDGEGEWEMMSVINY
jgi:hypothetical protein